MKSPSKLYKLIFIHLLNDYSGSPRVLKETISALENENTTSKLYIGHGSEGVLSECNITKSTYWYKRTPYRIFTLLTFCFSQVILFGKLLLDRSISKKSIIFVNTLLPFGAALYGKLTKRKVIYHIHEVSITPKPLKWFLIFIAKKTSSLNLYVSDYHAKALPISGVPFLKVYNSLSQSFINSATKSTYRHKHQGLFVILMVSSLRDYKGIPEFLLLAERLNTKNDIIFKLVLNDNKTSIDRYFSETTKPSSVNVYSRVPDTRLFYEEASLVLNLSKIDAWVETFGLTILEAMTYGIPTIVPPMGGPIELISDGIEGFLIDSRDNDILYGKVLELYANEKTCASLSENARRKAKAFSPQQFSKNMNKVINQL